MNPVTLEQIRAFTSQLDFSDRIALLQWLAEHVRMRVDGRVPKDLHGIFKGTFPENFDLDGFLHEVRTEWEKEWSEDGDFIP